MPLRGSRASVLNDVNLWFHWLAESRCYTYQAHLASAEGVLSLIPFGITMTGCSLYRCFTSPVRELWALVIRWCADDGA